MEHIKIGLIGCGKQALKHISGLRKIPGVELVLADINPQVAEKLGHKEGIPWVPDVKEIYNDPEVKAIDICTPTPFHVGLISRALETGRHFFCEKPLCENLAEARRIEALLNDRIGMVGYIYRFSPVFELGKKLFEDVPRGQHSLVLGRVVSAFFRLGGRGSQQIWKHLKSEGGGAFKEMLVHILDLALWYFGPVKENKVLYRDLLRPRRIIQGKEAQVDAEDYVLVRLKMECGVEVLLQADLITPAFTQFMEVQGENGTFLGSIQPEMASFIYCLQDAAGYPAGKTVLNYAQLNLFEAQMAEFVRSLRLKKEPSRCSLRESIQLLETFEKLEKD